MKDYYDILGISEEEKKLTGQEFSDLCKKRYHKLAMQYHPDRWANASDVEKKNAEEKFKDIAEANEILSDPNKRAQYDNGGTDFNFEGIDPMEIFRRMSGSRFGFGFNDFFNEGPKQNRGSDAAVQIEITLEEAYKGGPRTIQIPKEETCSHCKGTGSDDGQDHTCPDCKGKGFISRSQQFAPGQIAIRRETCRSCGGIGHLITKACHKCHGRGLETHNISETIDLPGGLADGLVIVIPQKGNAPEGGNGVNGDLRVFIHVKPHNYFVVVDGMNIIHYEEVPFNEAMLGFKKDFKCIDGSTVTVNAPELTKHGQAFIFKGKGMPNMNNNSVFGDYAVVINYKLPNKLTDKQREMLKNFNA